jgi:very-short-patch-repair endonuclease
VATTSASTWCCRIAAITATSSASTSTVRGMSDGSRLRVGTAFRARTCSARWSISVRSTLAASRRPSVTRSAPGWSISTRSSRPLRSTRLGGGRARRRSRAAIDEWSIDARPADSLLEVAILRLTERSGLPPLEFHPVIEGREVDFRVIGTPILLECDGWTFHGLNRAAFEHDRESDASLTAAGWIVIRFTYRAVTRSPRTNADRIRRNLTRWSDLRAPDAR